MAQLRIDKIFSENLGETLGSAIREQVLSLFNRQVPSSLGIWLNPLPFFGSEKKRHFKALWAACLQGMAINAAVNTILDTDYDEKMIRKTSFTLQQFTDDSIAKGVLSHLNADELKHYNDVRRQFLRLAMERNTSLSNFVNALYIGFVGENAKVLTPTQSAKALKEFELAYNLFVKLVHITLESPNSYKRNYGA